ncbi:MAG: winged helix-turn-helix transcriptional regulator [Sphingomonadales bacterium]|nr:winged helix-turn-helix transcriptional regulator [Sphingomonadales bacterium]
MIVQTSIIFKLVAIEKISCFWCMMNLHSHLPYRFAQLSLRIRRATTERYVRNRDISSREWRTLGMIGIKGPSTPTNLSELTGMDRATITRSTAKLMRLGLLSRSTHESDSRSVLLALTPKGAELCEMIVPKVARSGELAQNLFSPGEFALFLEFIDRLDKAISVGLFEQDERDEPSR